MSNRRGFFFLPIPDIAPNLTAHAAGKQRGFLADCATGIRGRANSSAQAERMNLMGAPHHIINLPRRIKCQQWREIPMDTKFKKGMVRGPGRPKGTPNKATTQLKEMILGALDESGGVAYLVERANDPRTASAFLTLVGKVLPMTISGDKDNPLQASLTVTFVKQSGKPS